MGSVAEIAEDVGAVVVQDVLSEAAAELGGRSSRRWAMILLAAVVGGVIAAFVLKRLRDV